MAVRIPLRIQDPLLEYLSDSRWHFTSLVQALVIRHLSQSGYHEPTPEDLERFALLDDPAMLVRKKKASTG